jgi:hypothetical protein|tara:strand:- start:1 stop:348 length:348 start_codon:yes stop_codon:yes gene_type:complete
MSSDDIKLRAILALDATLVGEVGVKSGVVTLDNSSLKLPSESAINSKIAELEISEPLEELRKARNSKLAETDFYALGDVSLSDKMKTYRQELRDITKTFKSMSDKDFKFPDKPEE